MSHHYGSHLKIEIDGGSHDPKMTLRMAGFPAGFSPDLAGLQDFLRRRAPGQNAYSTKRKESDIPHFLSGFTEGGATNGEEILCEIYNENQRSQDYGDIFDIPRPSHADYAAYRKDGPSVDLRGGGHFSGRLTSLLCVAGGLSMQYLKTIGIRVFAHAAAIAGESDIPFDMLTVGDREGDILQKRDFPTLSPEAGNRMQEKIEAARKEADSVGGVIECAVCGLPVGLGEHMFYSTEAAVSAAVFAIPGVKGIEFGEGFRATALCGSENNDPYRTDGKQVFLESNRAGGIIGGMTSGAPLVFRVAMKPTPSIGKPQHSVSLSRMENRELCIKGRHDPCIVPRAVPVVEAAAALAMMDLILDEQERISHGQ